MKHLFCHLIPKEIRTDVVIYDEVFNVVEVAYRKGNYSRPNCPDGYHVLLSAKEINEGDDVYKLYEHVHDYRHCGTVHEVLEMKETNIKPYIYEYHVVLV